MVPLDMNRKNIVFIGPLPPVIHGQSEAFDVLVSSELTHEAFSISVINLNFVNMPLAKKLFLFVMRCLYFRYLLIAKKPNAIYVSFGRGKRSFQRDSFFINAALLRRIPVILHCHGGDMPGLLNALGDRGLNKARSIFKEMDRVIVLSRCFSSDFEGLVDMERIRVVPNCFRSPSEFTLPLVGGTKGDTKGTVSVLFLSNVNPDKGFWEVLESISILRTRNCNVQLTFVGSYIKDNEYGVEELKRKTDDLIRRYGIKENVKTMGALYGKEKWEEYCKADIFVLPTYYKSEALPISIIEAMAAGCAIITTAYRGIVDLIDDGVEGKFVRQKDALDLADKIELLYADREKLTSMKIAAQKRALRNFTEKKHVDSILSILKEVAL